MTTRPRLTIKVNGIPVTGDSDSDAPLSDDLKDHLYMFYFQSTLDEQRTQWIVFPPPVESLLPDYTGSRARQLALTRTQLFAGNRTRWSPIYLYSADNLDSILSGHSSSGHVIGNPVLAPLDVEDLKEAYSLTTPTKAIRAIDRLLITVHNSSVK